MGTLVEIAWTGVVVVTTHPLRSLVTIACLVVVLVPYGVGMSISHGVQHEAELAMRHGPDIYVSASQFGRRVGVPISLAKEIEAIEGVERVTPRIVGHVLLGRQRLDVVIVGMTADRFAKSIEIVDGELPKNSGPHEFVIGTELAKNLKLRVGSPLLPFYRNRDGEKVSTVVGQFRSDVSLWQANMILTTFESASEIFDQPDRATELLVDCREGYEERVREKILRSVSLDDSRLSATTRTDFQALLPRGFLNRDGVFNLHFVLLFVAGILVVLVTSGVGLTDRRREIGILKATGWQTDEILLRGLVESLVVGLLAALIALLLAFVWLRFLNGYWVASLFLSGVGVRPTFTIPFRLMYVPALICVVLSLVMVMTGTLYSTWRSAIAPPGTVLR